MRTLSNSEMERALISILPKPLIYKNLDSKDFKFNNLNSFANYDLARGMLNHEKYCLVESISTVDSTIESSNVTPSNLDNLLLTISLMSYKKSKEIEHSGDILFSIPPFSFAYPLLLSYHFVLSHLSSNLLHEEAIKFPEGTGILIITDNIELLSHVWRTTINNNYLRDFVQVFTLEAGNFKPFNFNNKNKSKNKNFDGTLPWITVFRAYRNSLPETLEFTPEVIILDLLPLRHRKRADILIDWAKNHSKHIIIVAPSYDKVNEKLETTVQFHFPINRLSINEINQYFQVDYETKTNPITASWSIQSSLPYLESRKKIEIVKSKIRVNEFFDTIKVINEILQRSKTKNGFFPQSFAGLNKLLLKMLTICIPLEWYERTLWSKDQPTLLEKINRISKIIPNDREESIICETLMPHFYREILKIYEILKNSNINIRSQLLLEIFKKKINSVKFITLIVPDQIDCEELKVWLRSINLLNKHDIDKINVISQTDWANQQWKEVYLNEEKVPDLIIITSPWYQKYLSSFYFSKNTEVIMIDAYSEFNLIKYQINEISRPEGLSRLWMTLDELFNTNIMTNTEFSNAFFEIEVNEFDVTFSTLNNNKNEKAENLNINNLFDDQILFNMLSDDENSDLQNVIITTEHENLIGYEIIHLNNQFTDCLKVSIMDNGEKKIIYIPVDINLKVKKFNEKEIQSVTPFELKRNDIWVKVKEKKRRELFDEILKLASNTLLMKWININVGEWKLMIREVWHNYYNPGKSHKKIYEEIKDDVNLNGGKVESYLTVANWINGEVELVRSSKNLMALAKLFDDDRYLKRVKIIYKAMRELWGIYIKLGKSLGKLIDEQVTNLSIKQNSDDLQWINLGKDLVIPVVEVINTIDLLKISSVESDVIYSVHPSFTERVLNNEDIKKLMQKGLIKNE